MRMCIILILIIIAGIIHNLLTQSSFEFHRKLPEETSFPLYPLYAVLLGHKCALIASVLLLRHKIYNELNN